MKKPIVNLVIILVIVAAAIFVDIPRSNQFRVGNFTRSGNLYLGLDLQGGMQVLLEADVEPGTTVSAEEFRPDYLRVSQAERERMQKLKENPASKQNSAGI